MQPYGMKRDRDRESAPHSGGSVLPEFLVVGRILAPWGNKGEVKAEVMTDFPERFAPGRQVHIAGTAFAIVAARPHKGHLIIKLDAVDSIDAASKLRGHYIEVPAAMAAPLEQGEYYRFQIVGLEVWTEGGEFLGKVTEVLSTAGNDVFVVRGGRGEVLVPAIDDVVKTVDIAQGRITIEVIPGLIDDQ